MAQHEANLTITHKIAVPKDMKKGGIEIELAADGKTLGRLQFKGAHLYFKAGRQSEKTWDFTHLVEILKNTPSQY